MNFPFQPKAVLHRGGGVVVEITGIGHKTDRPQGGYSKDYWFYLGQVRWGDTGKTGEPNRHIEPGSLCADTPEGMNEIRELSDAMMAYLNKHGGWDVGKNQGWYAHRKERSAA